MIAAEKNQAAGTARRLVQCSVLLLVALPLSALGSRVGIWPYTTGLIILLISMAGSFLIQLIHSIWLLRKPAAATKQQLRRSSLFAMPPLFVAAVLMHDNAGLPKIHDITTNTEQPPEFIAAITERGSSSNPLNYLADNARQQRLAYPDIKTLTSKLSTKQAFQLALRIGEDSGWDIYAQSPQQGRIEAVDRTRWFGFRDDIVIRIKARTEGSEVDLRSVSRVGIGDFGTNARRIQQFSQKFSTGALSYQ